MKRRNVRTLSLVVCTFTYLLIGAAVFDALESNHEHMRAESLREMKEVLDAKYNFTEDDKKVIETVIIRSVPHKAGPQWKFAGAFYFATVVIALIGYGHSTPLTIYGKVFTIAYASIGIPLGLVMFQSIGERLNKFFSMIIKRLKTMLHCNATEATDGNLILATVTLSGFVMGAGATLFSHYEHWDYIDSLYYCFITLTTIGFGDFVALQNDKALSSKPGYVAMALVTILFGLAIVAASLNLLVLRFMTMNMADTRREEEVITPTHVDEDIIMTAGGTVSSSQSSLVDQKSVCSCTCYGHRSPLSSKSAYRPASIRDRPDIYRTFVEDTGSMLYFCEIKRASI